MANVPSETINHRGEVYNRHLIYSARLYPEKLGRLFIDSIKMKLQIPYRRNAFFGLSESRTATVISPKVEINVRPLPSEGVPKNFSGLVGIHEMVFTLNKSKFLTNEVVEGKLEITGGGLLEDFEPPALYTHDALEKFDTKSEIIKMGETARKIFDYTFIPRSSFTIKDRTYSLSFFNPEQEAYYEKTFELPALVVAGGGREAQEENRPKAIESDPTDGNDAISQDFDHGPTIVGPLDLDEAFPIMKNIKAVNLILAVIIFILLSFSVEFKFSPPGRKKILLRKIRQIQNEGITYRNFYDLLCTYYGKELSAGEIIQKSPIKAESKKYFKDILDKLGGHEYSTP